MDRKSEGKSKGLIALVVVLVVLLIGAFSYIGYDYYTDQKNEEESFSNADKTESLVMENAFRLKDVKCEYNDSSCEKEVKVAYNNENHVIKIKGTESVKEKLGEKSYATEVKYELYIDNSLVDTINAGPTTEESAIISEFNFDGYVYIFDGKYLGFLMNYVSTGGSGYQLNIYNDGTKVLDNPVTIDAAAQSFEENGSDLDGIDNIEFDGTTLKYWFLDCNNRTSVIRLGLTFDGTKTTIKVLETRNNIEGGGSSVCYNTETNSYSE